ncbi:MAG: hypothetical protein HOD58_11415 [Gammaproteobacteria bacterium]|jgi:hypothetical protein|nr:hypothetical protein [Gammaproteobacteria bacterium]MBT7480382.1 hypothetical protein [Gammaproteobacteria bacterium]
MTEQLALFISPLALRPYPVAISLIFFEGIPAMLNKTQAAQIDLLRNAAKEHPVVTRLLFAQLDCAEGEIHE